MCTLSKIRGMRPCFFVDILSVYYYYRVAVVVVVSVIIIKMEMSPS
jgi:hypothetical protein